MHANPILGDVEGAGYYGKGFVVEETGRGFQLLPQGGVLTNGIEVGYALEVFEDVLCIGEYFIGKLLLEDEGGQAVEEL